jgi:Transglutaminase-like superfamily
MAEINLRYADTMLARLRELNPAAPGMPRATTERLVGCCRDFTLLFVAMARHHGIPARARVGFARYLVPGWAMDHVIAEVWDGDRWRLVEPEMSPGHVDEGTELNLLDVPRDRFLVAADAWRACRSGAADPATFVVAPELEVPLLRDWPYLLHNLVLDLAALNRHEMILWDGWGVMAGADHVDEETTVRMDEVAAVLADPDAGLDAVRAVYAAADLRVPPVVTSLVEPGGPLVQVTLR